MLVINLLAIEKGERPTLWGVPRFTMCPVFYDTSIARSTTCGGFKEHGTLYMECRTDPVMYRCLDTRGARNDATEVAGTRFPSADIKIGHRKTPVNGVFRGNGNEDGLGG
jgi:hypothetical protein